MTAATTPKSKPTAAALSPARTKLCLALLVLLGFSLGCSEFVVIGIESDLATELGISLATAGQLISVFALVYAIATPVLALSTGRFRRYQLLVCYSVVFVLGNLVMALAPNFQVLFISRIVLGSVSGALLAVGVTYIPELLSPQQTSLAISVVYGAFSVAMVFVTSIGKFVADTLDWHVAMYGTLTFAVLICSALVAFMPRAGQTDEPATFREQAGLLREPSIITGMLIFLFGVGSVYVFYGYVTPYLEQVLGMDTVQASTTLMAYGVFCLISNILGGWIDARFGMKALLVTFVLQAAALLGLFAVGAAMPLALVFVFSLAMLMYLFSVSCITHFMDVARSRHPKSMVLASSVEPMAFNVGISFGTAVGGAVASSIGIAYVGAVGAAFSLVAWALTLVTIKLARWERRRQSAQPSIRASGRTQPRSPGWRATGENRPIRVVLIHLQAPAVQFHVFQIHEMRVGQLRGGGSSLSAAAFYTGFYRYVGRLLHTQQLAHLSCVVRCHVAVDNLHAAVNMHMSQTPESARFGGLSRQNVR